MMRRLIDYIRLRPMWTRDRDTEALHHGPWQIDLVCGAPSVAGQQGWSAYRLTSSMTPRETLFPRLTDAMRFVEAARQGAAASMTQSAKAMIPEDE